MRIGSGMIGETLARHLVKLGHDAKLANSRAVEGVAAIATDVATAATANDAARSEPTFALLRSPPFERTPPNRLRLSPPTPSAFPFAHPFARAFAQLRSSRVTSLS
jgi:hypothetical protein